jgi:hypothetical protein
VIAQEIFTLPTSESIILAFYALDSALSPAGVHIDCDIAELTSAIEAVESLSPESKFQLGLTLLQHSGL